MPSGASVSAAASGDAAQWAAPITDRRGSGDRPLGNVPPGRSGPRRGSQVGSSPEAYRKLSLASPLGGLVPSGRRSALDRASRRECPPKEGGEGNPLAFPHSPCEGPLATCPLSRLTAPAPPKGEPSLASPLGGGALQRRAERASCQPHRPLPWLSPLRARAPRSLILFWLTPIKVKAVGLCPTTRNPLKRVDLNFTLASLGLP